MSLVDVMELGRQGLAADRQALQTTSNNIANANTPGYSRQRPEFESVPQLVEGSARLVGGVRVKDVIRVHDDFVNNQLVDENRSLGGFKSRSEGLQRVEAVISHEGERVNDLVNRFFNDVRELSTNPEVSTLRNNVSHSASAVASGFRNMNEQLSNLRSTFDQSLQARVGEVNTYAKELASLNGLIHEREARNEIPNELHDKRDEAVRSLSRLLGIEALKDDQGNVSVTAGGVAVLVSGNHANELTVAQTPANEDKAAGSLDVCLKEAGGLHVLTQKLGEGEIGGMIHVRDKALNPALKHLDAVAFEFAKQINDVHREGVGSDGEGNRALFTDLQTAAGASRLLDLNEAVKGRPEAVAAAFETGNAGDNRVALRIADVQNIKAAPESMEAVGRDSGNKQTFNESLSSLIGDIGVKTREDSEALEHHEAIVKQLENYRQSVCGVSLEEEAINLMKFQSSFNACAKTMKVADDLMGTVLSIRP